MNTIVKQPHRRLPWEVMVVLIDDLHSCEQHVVAVTFHVYQGSSLVMAAEEKVTCRAEVD